MKPQGFFPSRVFFLPFYYCRWFESVQRSDCVLLRCWYKCSGETQQGTTSASQTAALPVPATLQHCCTKILAGIWNLQHLLSAEIQCSWTQPYSQGVIWKISRNLCATCHQLPQATKSSLACSNKLVAKHLFTEMCNPARKVLSSSRLLRCNKSTQWS